MPGFAKTPVLDSHRKRGVGIKIRVAGLEATQKKMEQVVRDMAGGTMLRAMRDATLIVMRSARINAPVDTGRLRASLTPDVRILPTGGIMGVVGSNISYAPYMELGTGTFVGRSPHYPPGAALNLWARRHGFSSGHQVARIIGMRGGLRPRYYLKNAVIDNQDKVVNLLHKVTTRIVSQ